MNREKGLDGLSKQTECPWLFFFLSRIIKGQR